jgi:hypothetical protein
VSVSWGCGGEFSDETYCLTDRGAVTIEQAWNGSGGGQSWVEPESAYLGQVQSSGMREMPDVAFEADPSTGVAIYDSIPYGGQAGWWEIVGTSVGAPSWSAILAGADQARTRRGPGAGREIAGTADRGRLRGPAGGLLAAGVRAPLPQGPGRAAFGRSWGTGRALP